MSADHSTAAERAPTGLAAYRAVLRTPGARPVALASLLGRLPNGMVSLGLILFLHEITSSFGSAGLVTGAFVVGVGITGPLLARLIDRLGSRWVLVGGTLAASAALALIVVLGEAGASPGVLAALALLAGAASPPQGSVVRRRWAGLLSAEMLPTAYAIEAIVIESMFIAGPALAGLLAATVGAGDALLFAAAVGLIGSIWFSTLVSFPPRPAEEATDRHWAGTLRSPLVRLLIATGLLMGAGIGGLELALPAFGAAHGDAALGGPFAAALSLGSLCGGVAYGAHSGAFGSPRRGLVPLGTLQGVTCLPMLLVGTKAEMFGAAALAGISWAPLITVRSRLIQAQVDAASVIEAFTWDGLSETFGASLSIALVGTLIAARGWRAGVVVSCAVPLAGALVASLGRAATEPESSGHSRTAAPEASP